jgi:hypothetical protein
MLGSEVESEILKIQVDLLRREIDTQSNTFDQIDSKTGVALGFMSVLLGQLCVAVIRMVSENHPIPISSWYLTHILFGIVCTSMCCALICGFFARWPRVFESAESFLKEEIAYKSEIEILRVLEDKLQKSAEKNSDALEYKAKWADKTYFFSGASMLALIVFSALLFFQRV